MGKVEGRDAGRWRGRGMKKPVCWNCGGKIGGWRGGRIWGDRTEWVESCPNCRNMWRGIGDMVTHERAACSVVRGAKGIWVPLGCMSVFEEDD